VRSIAPDLRTHAPVSCRPNGQSQVASAHALVTALSAGTVRMAALIGAQPPSALPAIIGDIARHAEPYRHGDHLRIPIAAVLARGTKT
jgi:hypothetical protein